MSIGNGEISLVQRAVENYNEMERERDAAISIAKQLQLQSANLLSEVNMLREQLSRSENDRIRLQAFSSGIMGRLLAINDTIAGAVAASIKQGVDAADHQPAEDAGRPVEEPEGILQRVSVEPAPQPATRPIGSPRAPYDPGIVGRLQTVDWGPSGRPVTLGDLPARTHA